MIDTTVGQRIAKMVEHFTKGNKSAFAKSVGISNQSLGEIVGPRQSAPSFAALQKIALAYPSVSLHWLVLGEEPMWEVTDEDQSHRLERFADEIEERRAALVKSAVIANDVTAESLDLWEVRVLEEEARINLVDANEKVRFLEAEMFRIRQAGGQDSPDDLELLDQLKKILKAFEAKYVIAARLRMRVERAQFGFNTSSVTAIYKLGDAETDGLYGGLLTRRLGISNEAAENLVKSGKIRATYIDGEGYRITEQAVRIFLGEF